MVTADEVRRTYPNPARALDASGTNYCVGGALCKYLDSTFDELCLWDFPPSCLIAEMLKHSNPSLDKEEAVRIALHITVANDAGDFEDAWAWLAKGLES